MKSKNYTSKALLIACFTASNLAHAQWTENASSVYLTSGTKNVGIGTFAPAFAIDVQRSGNASAHFKSVTGTCNLIIDRGSSSATSSVSYRTAGVPTWQTGTMSTDNFVIRNIALGAPALAVNNSDNHVGIGTNAPQLRLDVRIPGNVSNGEHLITVFGDGAGVGGGIAHGWYADGAVVTGGLMRSVNNFPLFIGTKGVPQAFTILDNGNAGIGTTTPTKKLHVVKGVSGVTPMTNAGMVLEGSSQTFMNILVPSGFETGIGFGNPSNNSDAGIYYNGVGTSKLDFRTAGNVTRMTIDATGKVGIGTVSPISKLHVVGDFTVSGNITAADGDIYLGPLNGSINAGGGLMDALVNLIADVDNHAIVAGDEDLYIEDDLEVGSTAYKPGGGTWSTISDARLKKDVKSYSDGLEQLMKINPVKFKYNDKVKLLDTDKEYVGIIAQEMQKVAPYMIEEKALFSKSHEDRNGNVVIDEAGQNFLTYDPNALTYMLVNAVKEQQKIIEKQAQRIEALEAMLKDNAAATHRNTLQTVTSKSTIEQNQPNPFNQSTVINYNLTDDNAKAQIIIRDLNGNMLKNCVLAQRGKGQVVIQANEFAQGTYTYSLVVNGQSIDTKLMVIVN